MEESLVADPGRERVPTVSVKAAAAVSGSKQDERLARRRDRERERPTSSTNGHPHDVSSSSSVDSASTTASGLADAVVNGNLEKGEGDPDATTGGSSTTPFSSVTDSAPPTEPDVASLERPLERLELSDRQEVRYVVYESELNMPDIMRLIHRELSEPYSIYTYRYFIHNWPHLCFMAKVEDKCVGTIVCKLDYHKKVVMRGYIAMLAVDLDYRKRSIGSTLVQKAIQAMIAQDASEVVLETEFTNRPALRLYENLGFVRDKRLFRYYLNGVDALRLKLWLR